MMKSYGGTPRGIREFAGRKNKLKVIQARKSSSIQCAHSKSASVLDESRQSDLGDYPLAEKQKQSRRVQVRPYPTPPK